MDKVVLAAGTFDILHLGHVHYLAHAKELGGKLVVVVATDKFARKHGKHLMHNQNERADLVKNLRMVDEVIIGDEADMLNSVKNAKPSIIYLGYDQHVPDGLERFCNQHGIEIIRDKCSMDPSRHKTSAIKRRMLNAKERNLVELINLSERNIRLCPWCGERSSSQFLKEVVGEVEELRQAFISKDYDNVKEEIGDIIWDLLTLSHICEKEGKFSSESVPRSILNKIENRKPWLIRGEKVSKEDAERIWKEAKKREK